MRIVRHKKNNSDFRWGIVEDETVREIMCDDSVKMLHLCLWNGNLKTSITYPYNSISFLPPASPRGVALRSPSYMRMRLAEIFGILPAKKISLFLANERADNPQYLSVGKTVIVRIFSADGIIDLGEQYCRVVSDEGVMQ